MGRLRQWFFPFLCLTLSGCVSVSLGGGGKTQRADGVEFDPPGSPFSEMPSKVGDASWISSKTGNTISFFSECGNKADPSLEQLQGESLAAFRETRDRKEERITYNGREALVTAASGDVDGIPVRAKFLVFKRNDCSYILGYSGVERHHAAELEQFETFLKNFKAP